MFLFFYFILVKYFCDFGCFYVVKLYSFLEKEDIDIVGCIIFMSIIVCNLFFSIFLYCFDLFLLLLGLVLG